ncbi:sugar-binding transcriptional regulator [Risungbinella massiliensis]|uniref:sugar-binding transcriptional regulator n=1 Tax=Risungbinella massiliensis TaxID=1329796 RepID=UPI0005CC4521|nr:sugar-binding domain-containing protein [Risungbinella massiliensis]
MIDLLNVQRKLLPDLLEVMKKRYEILRQIHILQPVGRRALTQVLQTTERVLRAEVDFLRSQGLVEIATIGMRLTEEGVELLKLLEQSMSELLGLSDLEAQLTKLLHINRVIVLPGDSDRSEAVKTALGRAAGHLLMELVGSEKKVIAVTGGSTMRAIAETMTPSARLKRALFLPARGGVGESARKEANFVVTLLAERAGGSYRLFHVPEQLSESAYLALADEPKIRDTLAMLQQADIVVYGIGEAKKMAVRRESTREVLKILDEAHAVGESFGYYFDKHGKIVHRVQTIGLDIKDLPSIPHKIAVAGGASKAEAIQAIGALFPQDILITDEAAAKKILNI